MRLAIAVSIVAHSLPVAASKAKNVNPVLLINNDNHQNLLVEKSSSGHQSALATNFLRRNRKAPTNDRFNNNRRGTLETMMTYNKEECDPATNEPDLGVLACGTGRYCMASNDSGLGGFCVHKPLMEMDRSLEADSWPNNGFLYSNQTSPFTFCQPENAYYAAMFFYDCRWWDPETETGIVSRESSFMPVYDDAEGYSSCELDEMFARNDEGDEFHGNCFRHFSYDSNAATTTTSLCFGLSESLSDLLPGTNCTMVVDGTTCNSCYFTPEPAETCSENQFMISTQRFIFDCENAGLGSNSYACIEDVPGCQDILSVCNKAIFA